MNKILLLVAHPDISASKANAALLDAVKDLPHVKIMHLYEEEFCRDTYLEAFTSADILLFQFPMYYGSSPSLLKRWSDEIFITFFDSPGYADKSLMVATTVGAPASAFTPEGINLYPVHTLLSPFHLQANFSGMRWLPEFVVYGVDDPKEGAAHISEGAQAYRRLLSSLA